jgi:hypothetical protein
MYLLETIYPLAIATANLALGWVLYRFSEPVFGGLLVILGLFVILTLIGSTLSRHRPLLREPT